MRSLILSHVPYHMLSQPIAQQVVLAHVRLKTIQRMQCVRSNDNRHNLPTAPCCRLHLSATDRATTALHMYGGLTRTTASSPEPSSKSQKLRCCPGAATQATPINNKSSRSARISFLRVYACCHHQLGTLALYPYFATCQVRCMQALALLQYHSSFA